jgi:hypothetical protein
VEAAAQRARLQALRDNGGLLADLEQACSDIARALQRVRAERVIAMASGNEPRRHVVEMLCEPPDSVACRQAWCALAYEIETYRDHHPDAVGYEHDDGVQAAIGPSPSSLSDRAGGRAAPDAGPKRDSPQSSYLGNCLRCERRADRHPVRLA